MVIYTGFTVMSLVHDDLQVVQVDPCFLEVPTIVDKSVIAAIFD